MPTNPTNDLTSLPALAARLDRVRALARRIVRDGAEADDLVQDAVVAALHHGVSLDDDAEGWLKSVVRNLAVDRLRRNTARGQREQAATRDEAAIDTAEAVTRAERSRDLVTTVLELDEQLREVIVLRYFEDLPPRRIATATGLAPSVVKSRLVRGLAQLRARLESRYGDGGRMAVALLPLACLPLKPVAATGAWIGAMGVASWSVVAAVLVVLGAWFAGGSLESTRNADESIPREVANARRTGAPFPGRTETFERTPRTAPQHLEETPIGATRRSSIQPIEGAEAQTPSFAAIVRDLDGAPRGDTEFLWRGPTRTDARDGTLGDPDTGPLSLRSNRDGRIASDRFEASAIGLERYLTPASPSLTVVGLGYEPDGAYSVIIAPIVTLAGHVVYDDGTPVAGARVTVTAEVQALTTFLATVEFDSRRSEHFATSDDDGRFRLAKAPTHRDFALVVAPCGRRQAGVFHRFGLPATDRLDLDLVIPRPVERQTLAVFGRVLEHDGTPAPGVHVDFGQDGAVTDASGSFRIDVTTWWPDADVTAAHSDGRFAVSRTPERAEARWGDGAGPVELRLPRSMPKLNVVIVDHSGVPCAGMYVALLESTRRGSRVGALERVDGEEGPADTAVANAVGAVRFTHMRDRPYVVRVIDPVTFFVYDEAGITPGTETHQITLPEERFVERVHGRVVDLHGQPVSEATVRLEVDVRRWGNTHSSRTARDTLTRVDGSFEMQDVPWRHVRLAVETPPPSRAMAARVALDEVDLTAPLLVEVDLPCELVVRVEHEQQVARIRFLDGQGEPMRVHERHSGFTMQRYDVRRTENGSFPMVSVSQRVATLSLLDASGAELRRAPVRLDASTRNEVWP
ncbi:MAG: sigma-70 family RNA polymerase sigma factor [Planctomycetota bacterium]